jgi:hypothetical protein
MSFVFMFVLLLQRSFSFTGPFIFLTVFRSNVLGALLTAVVVVQASGPKVAMGRIRVLQSCNSEY